MTRIPIVTRAGKAARPKVLARPFVDGADDGSKVHNLLTPHEQSLLARVATVLNYRAVGTTVFTEGEDAHFLYSIDKDGPASPKNHRLFVGI